MGVQIDGSNFGLVVSSAIRSRACRLPPDEGRRSLSNGAFTELCISLSAGDSSPVESSEEEEEEEMASAQELSALIQRLEAVAVRLEKAQGVGNEGKSPLSSTSANRPPRAHVFILSNRLHCETCVCLLCVTLCSLQTCARRSQPCARRPPRPRSRLSPTASSASRPKQTHTTTKTVSLPHVEGKASARLQATC